MIGNNEPFLQKKTYNYGELTGGLFYKLNSFISLTNAKRFWSIESISAKYPALTGLESEARIICMVCRAIAQ
jgi:hypothetical protein